MTRISDSGPDSVTFGEKGFDNVRGDETSSSSHAVLHLCPLLGANCQV
jgi:hypothetical protein